MAIIAQLPEPPVFETVEPLGAKTIYRQTSQLVSRDSLVVNVQRGIRAVTDQLESLPDDERRLHRPRSVPDILTKVSIFERAGDVRSALAAIYQWAERARQRGEIDEINARLPVKDAERFSSSALLAFLTATLPVKTRLSARKALFREVKRILKKRGQYERGVLSGLG